MNSANGAANGRGSRPRAQSIKGQGNLLEEGKISEEDAGEDAERVDGPGDYSLSDEDLHDDEETGLTNKDRRRKRQKKRHNTLLDQRIAKDSITAEEKKEADQNVMRRLAINGLLILLWYLFSLSISLVSRVSLAMPSTTTS
jgi:solute carrier family 35, member C2